MVNDSAMKKRCYILLLFICFALICSASCGAARENETKATEDTSLLQSDMVHIHSFSFQSYSSLSKAFQSGTEENEWVLWYAEENEKIADLCRYISSGKGALRIPCVRGSEMPFYERSGFSNITLFEKELFGEPWIWYYGKVGANMVTVQTMYYGNAEQADVLSRSTSCSEFLKILAPTAPNIDNYTQFQSYRNVYEKTVRIGEKDIRCLVAELAESSQIYFEFVFDDMFVILHGQSTDIETLIDDGLSFSLYS